MLGLTVYADDSGIHDKQGLQRGSEVTAIAGYVASKEHWDLTTRRWNTVLRKFGVDVFHMSSYWREESPYDRWTEAKQKRFLKNLIKVARDNTCFAIGAMVPTKDWNEALPEDIKGGGLGSSSFAHPYHFCFQMFFARFMDLLTTEIDKRFPKTKEKVAFVFEQQHEFEDVAKAGFPIIKDIVDPDNRLSSLTFGSKKEYIPLQAADLIAFYARRILTHEMEGRAWRDPFEQMLEERHNLMLHYYTRDQLFDFAREAMLSQKQRQANQANGIGQTEN